MHPSQKTDATPGKVSVRAEEDARAAPSLTGRKLISTLLNRCLTGCQNYTPKMPLVACDLSGFDNLICWA